MVLPAPVPSYCLRLSFIDRITPAKQNYSFRSLALKGIHSIKVIGYHPMHKNKTGCNILLKKTKDQHIRFPTESLFFKIDNIFLSSRAI